MSGDPYRTPNLLVTSGGPGTTIEKIGIPSASLPCWRTGLGLAGRKLMGHTEQVSQHISLDARQAHQHYIVGGVVVCHVVNIRVRGEICRSEEHTSELQSPCNIVC